MGWTNPWVLLELLGGIALLAIFAVIETRVAEPMFDSRAVPDPRLHRRQHRQPAVVDRAWRPAVHADHLAAGHLAARCTATASSDTPLWAGIYMLPLTVGFLIAGPLSGWLSDRYGARPFATGGMLLAALVVRAAHAAAGQLLVPGVRRSCCS